MAQQTILAAGVSAANSTDIVVGSTPVSIGVFSAAAGDLPAGVQFNVMQKTPGAANKVARINNDDRLFVLTGPGTYFVARPAYNGTGFGVFTDSVDAPVEA
jgi:hypothetical protein